MASRAVWKGQLRLSLVAIPVELHPATRSGARLSFRQIHGPSGKPVRYEKTVAGVGPVKSDEILKGYELGKGDYLLLQPEDIDAIKLETRKTLELVQFVDQGEISPLYFDRPYYVIPSDDLAQDAYRVVRDALRAEGKTALGQLTMRGREYLCAIRPCGDGLLLETLRYEDEIREAAPLFSGIEDQTSDEDLLDVATQLIRRKSSPFDAGVFRDHYDEALRALIEAKRKSRKTPRAKLGDGDEPRGGGATNVVDLMSALKESLKKDGGAKPRGRGKKSA
ncbi:non-homologous end joining protein Ku [Paracoccus sp. (in: a-proteobacteria)]|uniref:non-homologous end joining protein Ku n=1 Tax=Paracoccus sp. TaxID=267 RepID=UPI00272AFDA5|nr:Ku protein [Paracoccus sp. (in: a-proteobacteria)]